MQTIVIEDKTFSDQRQAVTELAFAHYPVKVEVNGVQKTFATFDAAREFVLGAKA